ncbi:MAG: hypothetical protein L6R43_14855 [Planctomycetes bacterium]|nr:hypothetical protein [Planctomycetota bacterium]
MTRAALAAAILAAGCASTPAAAPARAPAPAAYSVEVRFERTGGETVLAPRLFVFAGQRATVQVLRQESYIQSFDLSTRDGATIADPVIGSVQGGVLLDARTVPLEDGSGARFEYRLTAMEPRKPFGERKVPLAGEATFTVQLPEVEKVAVAGAAALRDGEERAVAVLPWPGPEGGAVTVKVRIRGAGAEEAAALGGGDAAEVEAPAAAAPVAPGSVVRQGWFRMRSVRMAEGAEQGTVVEGTALRRLLDGGGLVVERDLQWAGAEAAPPEASVLTERPFLTDYEPVSGQDLRGATPRFQTLSSGLLVDRDAAGGYRLTLSSFRPLQTFTTSLGGPLPPVTIDLPEIHVCSGNLPAGPGERLFVLGPREDGGVDGVLLSFRPGAKGPEE